MGYSYGQGILLLWTNPKSATKLKAETSIHFKVLQISPVQLNYLLMPHPNLM